MVPMGVSPTISVRSDFRKFGATTVSHGRPFLYSFIVFFVFLRVSIFCILCIVCVLFCFSNNMSTKKTLYNTIE